MRLKVKWINGWAHIHGTSPDGRRVRRAAKTKDPRRAEEIRASVEDQLWKADIYGPEATLTFDECALHYAEDGGDMRFLVQITEQLSGLKLKEITPKTVRDAARRAYPNASPATLNRQGITPARAVINYGHSQGWCSAIKVKSFPAPRPQRRAVGRDYIEQLAPHVPHRLYVLMLFLHQTGRRVGDAVTLTPENVRDRTAYFPKTKNGEAAIAKMTPEVAALVADLAPRHGRVFGYVGRSSVYKTLRRACEKAGVEYLGTHQPGRHSFATTLEAAGWGSKDIAEAGGWKSVRLVAETYEHPQDSQSRAADVFGKILASKPMRKKKNH